MQLSQESGWESFVVLLKKKKYKKKERREKGAAEAAFALPAADLLIYLFVLLWVRRRSFVGHFAVFLEQMLSWRQKTGCRLTAALHHQWEYQGDWEDWRDWRPDLLVLLKQLGKNIERKKKENRKNTFTIVIFTWLINK